MDSDSVFIICASLLVFMTWGDPDLLDALIHYFMNARGGL